MLTKLIEVNWDWCIYLQSGKLEDRSIVTQNTEFSISKFLSILKSQKMENDQKNSAFSMVPSTRDLMHFSLFICKALGVQDWSSLSPYRTFYSKDNLPIRGLMHLATELNHEYIVEQLIRSPLDVNQLDKTHQTAFDIAVNEDLKKIKVMLLKRSDLILINNKKKLSEHSLRIWILDGDQESARMILENYSFKKYIRAQLCENSEELEQEFSKLMFDVWMIFRDDYKSSIFIMHDLIK